MELRDAGIRMWTFDRTSVPSDLTSTNDSSPDPSQWGTPVADFPAPIATYPRTSRTNPSSQTSTYAVAGRALRVSSPKNMDVQALVPIL
jgi:hypothetical protein